MCSFFKDLGIFYSPLLSFKYHINVTICKALKISDFMKRNTKMFSSASSFRFLYFFLVRSVLKYGVIVEYPYLTKNQLRIKPIQNEFLSYISHVFTLNITTSLFVSLLISPSFFPLY